MVDGQSARQSRAIRLKISTYVYIQLMRQWLCYMTSFHEHNAIKHTSKVYSMLPVLCYQVWCILYIWCTLYMKKMSYTHYRRVVKIITVLLFKFEHLCCGSWPFSNLWCFAPVVCFKWGQIVHFLSENSMWPAISMKTWNKTGIWDVNGD